MGLLEVHVSDSALCLHAAAAAGRVGLLHQQRTGCGQAPGSRPWRVQELRPPRVAEDQNSRPQLCTKGFQVAGEPSRQSRSPVPRVSGLMAQGSTHPPWPIHSDAQTPGPLTTELDCNWCDVCGSASVSPRPGLLYTVPSACSLVEPKGPAHTWSP